MGDSSDDADKVEYLKKDLLHPIVSRPWQNNGLADDDSNNLFMSEPSVSEVDSTEHHMHLLSPLGSYTEGEGDEDELLPPAPPPARLLQPSSPGNTSLSSWESPHWNRHVQVHFSPDHREGHNPIPPNFPSNQKLNMPGQPSNPRNVVGEPSEPLPSGAKTPDRSYINSSNSTSPASEGQQRLLEVFLDDLRLKSEGQMQESAMGANTSFESSFHGPNNPSLDLGGVIRNRKLHTRTSSVDTAVMQNTSVHSEEPGAEDKHKGDETVAMVLSDSGDETRGNTTNDDSTRPLDWEEKVSADDEKTAERPSRQKSKPQGGRGHRRQRSGDAVAASLSTGSMDWKGMEQDNIPIPPEPNEHDDEEDDVAKALSDVGAAAAASGAVLEKEVKSNVPVTKETEADKASGRASIFDPNSKFSLGTGDSSHATNRRQARGRQRRDSRARRVSIFGHEMEDSSSAASGDPSPLAGSGMRKSFPAASTAMPSPTLSGYMPSPDMGQQFWQSQPLYWSPQQYTESPVTDYQSRLHPIARSSWNPDFHASMRDINREPQVNPTHRKTHSGGWEYSVAESMQQASNAAQQSGPEAPYYQSPHPVSRASWHPNLYSGGGMQFGPRQDTGLRRSRSGGMEYSTPGSGSSYLRSSPSVSEANSQPSWHPDMHLSMRGAEHPFHDTYARSRTRSGDFEYSTPGSSERHQPSHQWGRRLLGSIRVSLSWLNLKKIAETTPTDDGNSSEMSPLVKGEEQDDEGVKDEDSAEDSMIFPFPSEERSKHSEDAEFERVQRKSNMLNSPFSKSPLFANIGKTFGKPDRRRFLPQTTTADDERKHAFFVCPVCKTRQRDFFTVTTAPRQIESATGYISLYFAIYVVAALYIFGRQEGWSSLDCIYFAVITLTTAGLGDFVPTSDGAKVVCSVFIYFGVACIGLLLGSYIAGMLDETSMREARQNRIKSCPNCARIKNINDAAQRQRRAHVRTPSTGTQSLHMSMRVKEDVDMMECEQENKRVKRQNGRASWRKMQQQTGGQSTPGSSDLGSTQSWSPNEQEESGTRMGNTPQPQGGNKFASLSPRQPRNVLGSPSTTQMLARQSHSRHASIDLHGSHFAAALGNVAPASGRKAFASKDAHPSLTRRFTTVPATIDENGTGQQQTPMMPPPQSSSLRLDDVEADDESTDTYSSSESSVSVDLDTQYNTVKNARYVLLTLREALMNSLVIIGFGCMGFYLIEGFSLIDSWYFTTVLLTTVGYGDLVPCTKGGKLFATVYILVAGSILLNNMSMISMIPLELRRRRTEKAVLTQFGDSLDDTALRELATGPLVQRLNLATHHPGGLDACTREMFCLAMLVRLGKVTVEDVKLTFAAFGKLDVHGEGILNSKAIIAGMIQKRRPSLNRVGEIPPGVPNLAEPPQVPPQNAYGTMQETPPASWANSYGNVFVPNLTPRNDLSSMGGTFDSATGESVPGMSNLVPPYQASPMFHQYSPDHANNVLREE